VFINVTTGTADNFQITAGQLQDMLATTMATIQAEGHSQKQEKETYT
jgi:hypothetical protein